MSTAMVKAADANVMIASAKGLEATLDIMERLVEFGCLPKGMKPAEGMLCASMGHKFGWNPLEACQRFHVINGTLSMKADVMVGVAKAHDACRYFRCTESTSQRATFETHREGSPEPERETFTIEDARQAGLMSNKMWSKYPRQMLRARCSAALARLVYPDILAGIYTPDEAGRPDVGLEPNTIEAEFIEQAPHHAAQPGRERRSAPPQQQDTNAAAAGGVGSYAWLLGRIRHSALTVALNAYFRAKEADPSKAQTVESIKSWNSAERWTDLAEKIGHALPSNLVNPAVAYDTAKLHLRDALGRQPAADEVSALMQRVKTVAPGLSPRNQALACCLLAARCARKPETLHLRLGLPKVGE